MKLFAIDMDGTLLNEEGKISKVNAEAIRQAQQQGVQVAIATGRASYDAWTKLEEAGLAAPVIGANGATVHDTQRRLLTSTPMDRDETFEVLSWLRENDFYYEVMTDRAIYSPQYGHQLLAVEMDRLLSANSDISLNTLLHAAEKQYEQAGLIRITSYEDIPLDVEIYNVLCFSFDQAKLDRGRERYRNFGTLNMVISSDHNFEVEHKDASKGNALRYLADHLSIPMQEAVAIGDSYNDISMLTMAGKGIAMGNAKDDIKAVCSEVTLTNIENGVAHALLSILEAIEAEADTVS
ncbi:Cof-type HAD-IIB family hydrolase [Paenibacillus peoriae]|uniref:Cof-type HAD-IIB family hydrolase n=1 Tax=Paenibacillus peoriae TaxID=59893 RepID=UPI00026C60F8|nr:Cof-type HAD-IIB family hydrolase [Paenibacillus peoriae]MEC0180368.1 Cof-type HAD-IIB family hydrolase [Paenibacillus peoriae]